MENNIVEFCFKNTRKNSVWEATTLPIMTFIKRFLDHVMPKHSHRIRYYGFLANGRAGSNIEKIHHALSGHDQIKTSNEPDADQLKCPSCQKGTIVTFLVIEGYRNIMMDGLPDPIIEHEPQTVYSS